MTKTVTYYSIDGKIFPLQKHLSYYLGVSHNTIKTKVSRAGGGKKDGSFTIQDKIVNIHTTSFVNKNAK